MPYLSLHTNAEPTPSEKEAFLIAASHAVSEHLGKSEDYFMGTVTDCCTLYFSGNQEPGAMVELASIGFNEEHAGGMAGILCELVSSHFHVPQDRIYVRFHDSTRSMWGWNGKTFG